MQSKNTDLNILVSIMIVALFLLGWSITNTVSGKLSEEDSPGTYSDNGPLREYKKQEKRIDAATTSTTVKAAASTSISTPVTTTTFPALCFRNTDCGMNGTWTTREYTCYQGDIYRQYISYRCAQPGTPYAECVGKEKLELVKNCGANEGCIYDEPLCEYTGDLENRKALWVPKNCTTFSINSFDEKEWEGYGFTAYYVPSENSAPKGLMLYIIKPGGTEARQQINFDKGTHVDDLLIGLSEMKKTGFDIKARVWIQ
ncbi:MAG: hypothetical protein JW724_06920 [Candidatus Altiarchaeota archaeon]|nr:hypothetical protein [Candidatus Altiarchaeota archaeon]